MRPSTLYVGRPCSSCTVSFTSRWVLRTVLRRMMLIVPAMAWAETSAVGARWISMRSMASGASESIEKPRGAGSPSIRIWV
jgi:hypothetical protein